MKKTVKFVGILFLVLSLCLTVFYFVSDEPLPIGKKGRQADLMANKMLTAVNVDAWNNTNYVRWTFKNVHHFVWDKERKFVKVKWDNIVVDLNLNQLSAGYVIKDNIEIGGEEKKIYLDKAWRLFANDSFWLIAPLKVFDEGVERSVVSLNEGGKGLLITYNLGGVTPGDSYLWVLGDDGLPLYYKMWVSILPIGGIKATWSNWEKMPTGVVLPTYHDLSFLSLPISDLTTGMHFRDLGLNNDPFVTLSNAYEEKP